MASAARTSARAAFTPSRWPATRGKPLRVAQRPLPSMMTATCAGTGCERTRASSSCSPSPSRAGAFDGARLRMRESPGLPCVDAWLGVHDAQLCHTGYRAASFPERRRSLERQDLLLLLLQQLVDLGHELVGGLLHLVVGAALLVLGRFLLLGGRLQLVVRLAPHVAHGHPGVLGHLVHGLHQLLAALLRRRGHVQTDELAVVHGREAEIGLLDGLLDGADLPGLPGL